MNYKFTYRRLPEGKWIEEKVIGHKYEEKVDKMVLYYEDGGLREIAKWAGCEIKLGIDWVLAYKKGMEKQAGQAIIMNTHAAEVK